MSKYSRIELVIVVLNYTKWKIQIIAYKSLCFMYMCMNALSECMYVNHMLVWYIWMMLWSLSYRRWWWNATWMLGTEPRPSARAISVNLQTISPASQMISLLAITPSLSFGLYSCLPSAHTSPPILDSIDFQREVCGLSVPVLGQVQWAR